VPSHNQSHFPRERQLAADPDHANAIASTPFQPTWLYSGVVNATQEVLRLTPVYEDVDGGWTQARLVELPGVITAAPTRDQAEAMLLDALREFLLSFGPTGAETPTVAASDAMTLTISVGRVSAA